MSFKKARAEHELALARARERETETALMGVAAQDLLRFLLRNPKGVLQTRGGQVQRLVRPPGAANGRRGTPPLRATHGEVATLRALDRVPRSRNSSLRGAGANTAERPSSAAGAAR